jgi:hypothetical protein
MTSPDLDAPAVEELLAVAERMERLTVTEELFKTELASVSLKKIRLSRTYL